MLDQNLKIPIIEERFMTTQTDDTNLLTIYKQIYPNQLTKLATLGYQSVLNIRPDNEVDTQPSSALMQQAAAEAQLSYSYLPFDNERLSIVTVERFAELYHNLPKPILMYCGSGMRAKLLYQSALMQGLL